MSIFHKKISKLFRKFAAPYRKLSVIHDKVLTMSDKLAEVDNKLAVLDKLTEVDNKLAVLDKHVGLFDGYQFYSYKYELKVLRKDFLIEHVDNFSEKFGRLISGLDKESVDTVVKVFSRVSRILKKEQPVYNLFTEEEKTQLQRLHDDFTIKILQLSPELYYYNGYFLPINHFESSVFYYKHSLEHIKNIEQTKQRDIIDVGGFIGDSALVLAPYTDRKIYCFEASPTNFKLMKKTIQLNGLSNVVPVEIALSDCKGQLFLEERGSATIASPVTAVSGGGVVVKADTLDNFVKKNNLNVGLIKVDIEGAEQSFLRGAIETIKNQKPILVLSIYHNIDDFLEIKPMIEDLNLGYRFKIVKPLNHAIRSETLLFCEA